MLGHLVEWFYSGIGGIRQAEDSKSYDNILICPEIVGEMTWAETSFKTDHGEIVTNWKIEADKLILMVKIPVNCRAVVAIPQTDPEKITENNLPVLQSKDIENVKVSSGRTLCEISSGEYIFKSEFNK